MTICKVCEEPAEPALQYEIDEPPPNRLEAGLCRDCWDGAKHVAEDFLFEQRDRGEIDEDVLREASACCASTGA